MTTSGWWILLYVTFVRSQYGHAKITKINTDAAKAAKDVVTVYTGKDFAEKIPSMIVGWMLPGAELKVPNHPAMAVDTVRYTGEIVAAVVTRGRASGRDAANLIEVEYESLPAVVDVEAAVEKGAPVLHQEAPDNVAFRFLAGTSAQELDDELAKAEVRVSGRIVNQRLIPNAMEPRGITATFNKGSGELTIWTSTQVPHVIKLLHALSCGVPEQKIRVIAPDVGGGFGSKLYLYAEDMLMARIAIELGKPVKWIEEKRESYVATTHGRDHVQYAEIGATKDGKITAFKIRLLANIGAWESLFAPGVPTILFASIMSGCYKIPKVGGEMIGVFTNTTPVDAYRGAGRPEAAHLVERMIDLLAAELGKDPSEVRRLNFVPWTDYPYQTPTGAVYDSGNYTATMDKALQFANYAQLREEQKKARAEGRLMGIGMSSYVEVCGAGPSKIMIAAGSAAPAWESCHVRVHATGKVQVFTGASSHGQGHETSFAQLASSSLGIPVDDIDVVHGDTGMVQFGIGTFASRSMPVGGGALHMSLEKIKEKVKQIAAFQLEANVDDIEFKDGKLSVAGDPSKAKMFGEIAFAAFMANNLPEGMEAGLEATSFFDPQNFTWPFGTHICVTDVDPDTGKVKITGYYAVDDCGPLINPMLAEGQVHGGVAQGIGQALYEAAVYDEDGQLMSGSLMDYAIPTAEMLPDFHIDHTVTLSPSNPWGVKGIGEAGTIAASGAVVNSVVDALSQMGIRHLDMPLTPEKIWKVMRDAKNGKKGE